MPLVIPRPLSALDGHTGSSGFMVAKILAECCQGLLYGPECGLGQLPLAVFPTFAPVGVIDCLLFLGEVSGFKIQYFGAPPAREDQGQNDGPIPESNWIIRDEVR